MATIFAIIYIEDEYDRLWQLDADTYADVHKQRQPRLFHDRSYPLMELYDYELCVR